MSSSVGRNSLIMASGTAASRLTGQIRTILLAAAMGTTGLAANAYQAGAMIPQVLYTLVSGGIFNAVLVPQIVRTLKEKDAEERLNKLITVAIALLLAVTVLMVAATPLLTKLYVNGSSDMMALTNAFTLWCMPQIFFYGLYTVIGQVLAAFDHFGTYAWSSVGANVISCVGFTAFIVLFGRADQQSIDFWTSDKIAFTAGAWTLGVAFQALILFIPLLRSGFRYKPAWGLHGIGLRSMGPVAAWSIGVVVVNQIANVITTRITTSAPNQATLLYGLSEYDVAGNATYQNAYTLFMLPYSLIAVSVSTAMFPRISQAIADNYISEARTQLSTALRNVGLLMFFFSVAFLVIPVPITLTVLPSVSVKEAILIAGPLMGLGCGLPLSAAYLIIQRTFYAFEDGKHPFIFAALSCGIQLVIIITATYVLSPEYWVTALGVAIPLGNLFSFPVLIAMLRRRFGGRLDGQHLATTYVKGLLASAVAVVVGLLVITPVYSLLGAHIGTDDGTMNWLQAFATCVLMVIILLVAYVGMLWLLRTEELASLVNLVQRYLQRFTGSTPAVLAKNTPIDGATTGVLPAEGTAIASADIPAEESANTQVETPGAVANNAQPAVAAVPMQRLTFPESLAKQSPQNTSNTTIPVDKMTPVRTPSEPVPIGVKENMKPQLGDTVLNRYVLVASLRQEPGIQAWKANDRVLARDCQLFIINDSAALPQVNATASTLAVSRDSHCTRVLQLRHHGDIAIIITQLDAGLSLSEYLAGPARDVLTYDAIRSIIGESVEAAKTMHQEMLDHRALSVNTIRVSTSGVQFADTPISPMIGEPVDLPQTTSAERRTVCQLATVLYALLTRTAPSPTDEVELSALPNDIPNEFHVICSRGLYRSNTTDQQLPMESLSEFGALLGDWKPLNKLSERDIALPGTDGECSIATVPLIHTAPENVLAIPEDISTSAASQFSFSLLTTAENDENDESESSGAAGLAAVAAGTAMAGTAVANTTAEAAETTSETTPEKTEPTDSESDTATANTATAGVTPVDVAAAGAKTVSTATSVVGAVSGVSVTGGEETSGAVNAAVVTGATGAAATAAHAVKNVKNAAAAGAAAIGTAAASAADASANAIKKRNHSGGNALRAILHKGKDMLKEGIDDGHDDTGTIQPYLFDPFEDHQTVIPDDSHVTRPIQVASVRAGTGTGEDDTNNPFEQTSRIPVIGADGTVVAPGAESQRALAEEQAAIEAAERAGATADATTGTLPPSFNPGQSSAPEIEEDDSDDVADQPLVSRLGTKIVAIVAVVVLVAVALGFAVNSFLNEISSSSSSQSDEDAWPDIDLDSVPFGDSDTTDNADSNSSDSTDDTDATTDSEDNSGADSSSNSDGETDADSSNSSNTSDTSDDEDEDETVTYEVITSDKEADAVPTPIHTNTTPYQISSQTFLQSPGGQDGYAYVIRLSDAEEIYRMSISITTSGGQGYILVGTTNDPTAGEQVAQFTFDESGTTTVTFDEVVDTDTVMLWIPEDDLPDGQIYVQQIQLY